MSLADLFVQHQRDIETFKTLRDATWANLRKEHEAMAQAFGGRENMPEVYSKRIDEQIASYHKEWSMEGGSRYREITEQHEKQRTAITGKKIEHTAQEKIPEDMVSEKQNELQKIIAIQQAIRHKQQQKKQQQQKKRK